MMKRIFLASASIPNRFAPYLRYSLATVSVLALHSASLFCVVALLARWAAPETLGHYVLGYAISSPVFMFLNARQRIVLVNHTGKEDPTWDFVRSRIYSTAAGLLAIWIFTLSLWGHSAPEKTAVIMLVAAVKAAESIGDIAHGGLQKAGALNAPLRLIAVRAMATIAVAFLIVPLTGNALVITSALIVIWSAISLLGLWQLSHRVAWSGTSNRTAHSLLLTITNPLASTVLLGSLAYYVPRYFLNLSAGDAALGQFGALSYFGLVMLMVGNAAGDALVPLLTQKHKDALASHEYRNAVRRLYGGLLGIGGLGIVILLMFGRPLLSLLLGPQYQNFAPLTAILLGASVLTALVNCQAHALAALQLHQAQLHGALLSFAALLTTSALLVPRFGMAGAAWSELVYALLYLLLMERLMARALRNGAGGIGK